MVVTELAPYDAKRQYLPIFKSCSMPTEQAPLLPSIKGDESHLF